MTAGIWHKHEAQIRKTLKVVALHEEMELKNDVLRERLERGRSSKTQHFIVLLNKVEVGLLIYEDWGLPSSFIYEIFVLKDARSDGIGNLLLSQAEMIATQLGRSSIRLIPRSLCREALCEVKLTAWYKRRGYSECASVDGQLEKFLVPSKS